MSDEVAIFLDTNVLFELTFRLAFKPYITRFEEELEKSKSTFPIMLIVSNKVIEEYNKVISRCCDSMSGFIRKLKEKMENRKISEISRDNFYGFYQDLIQVIREVVEVGRDYSGNRSVKATIMREFAVIALAPLSQIASEGRRISREEYLTTLQDYCSKFNAIALEMLHQTIAKYSIQICEIPYTQFSESIIKFFMKFTNNDKNDAVHLASFVYYQFKENIWTEFITFDYDILLSDNFNKTYLICSHPAISIPIFRIMLANRLGNRKMKPCEWYYETFKNYDKVSDQLAELACIVDQMIGKEILPKHLYQKYLPTYRQAM